MYARINSPAGIVRLLFILAVFTLAGVVTCEWLLASNKGLPPEVTFNVNATVAEAYSATDSQSSHKDPKPKKITVATWNLEWFYDDQASDNRTDLSKKMVAPSRKDWEWKKSSVAKVIAEIQPTILCLQEVENRDVVFRLRTELKDKYDLFYRYAFISGYDFGTEQDVAILYRSGLVEYSRREQAQEMFETKEYYNLSKHMLARFQWGTGDKKKSLLLLNTHLRAGEAKSDLRVRQCRLIHSWLQDEIKEGGNVMAIGDFNTEYGFGTETGSDEMSVVRGIVTRDKTDDLYDANEYIAENERSTHLSGKQFDRVLFSAALGLDTPRKKDLVFESARVYKEPVVNGSVDRNHWDGYYDIPQAERDISDHYPLVVTFAFK